MKRRDIKRTFCVKTEVIQITLSVFTQNFFNLKSDDIEQLLIDYFNTDEENLINILEDITKREKVSLSWLVEYVIIRSHYKDIYDNNDKYLQQHYPNRTRGKRGITKKVNNPGKIEIDGVKYKSSSMTKKFLLFFLSELESVGERNDKTLEYINYLMDSNNL